MIELSGRWLKAVLAEIQTKISDGGVEHGKLEGAAVFQRTRKVKKPTRELFLRQRRLAMYREAQRRKRRGKVQVESSNRYVAPGRLIRAPVSFDLIRGGGKPVTKFLRAVARAVLDEGQDVRLDFKLTESFYVPGAILLFAEIDRIVSLSKLPKPITIIDPRARRPREVMKQIGLHELTGDHCSTVPQREDVVYWKTVKGKSQSGDQLAVLEVVAERVNRHYADQIQVSGIWRGVSEAVANSVEHAYLVPRQDGFAGLEETKWWMFTQVKDSHVTFAVCDLGCGYRSTVNSTLPEKWMAEIGARFAGKNRDAAAIRAAMEYGRSGTKEGHRGKGSRDALSVLEKHRQGDLAVLSNSGFMRYSFGNGKELQNSEGNLGISIKGTIIWWKLPLKEAPHDHR